MPIYEYAASAPTDCLVCARGFDLLQRLADPSLTRCPECGGAIHRVIAVTQVVSGQRHVMNEKHIAEHGFTQYRRVGKGKYEKTVGNGPPTISGD